MAKKYFQAKKQKNPFGKKHPNATKNRLIMIVVTIFFAILAVSSGVTYLSNLAKKKGSAENAAKISVSQEVAKKRVVQPISDEDFKGAKEYNFYTQLEERSLVMGAEDKFGGALLTDMYQPPMISLESMSANVDKSLIKTDKIESAVSAGIVPLVLESASQQREAPIVSQSKTVILQVGSFSSMKDAQKQQDLLKKHGFSTQVAQGKNQAQHEIYRVHLGPFGRQEVESIKKRLNALGIKYFEVK